MAYQSALEALSSPTRRQILDELRSAPLAVGELAGRLPVSRPAVSQHLRVLQEAGLVDVEAHGRRNVYRVERAGLQPLREWLDGFWDAPLAAYAAHVEQTARRPHRTGRRRP